MEVNVYIFSLNHSQNKFELGIPLFLAKDWLFESFILTLSKDEMHRSIIIKGKSFVNFDVAIRHIATFGDNYMNFMQ